MENTILLHAIFHPQQNQANKRKKTHTDGLTGWSCVVKSQGTAQLTIETKFSSLKTPKHFDHKKKKAPKHQFHVDRRLKIQRQR